MSRAPVNEGLRSEALRAALTAALGGKFDALEDLLRRYGDGHGARPNLRLAASRQPGRPSQVASGVRRGYESVRREAPRQKVCGTSR